MIKKKTVELEEILTQARSSEIHAIIEQLPAVHLQDYLNELMIKKNLQKSSVIQESLLPRTYGYQIFQGTKQAGRDKMLQLAIGMHCTLEETNRILTLAGHNRLYAKQQRDAVLIFGIHHQMSISEIEGYLNDYHLPLLAQYD